MIRSDQGRREKKKSFRSAEEESFQNGVDNNYVIIGFSPDIVVKDHYWVCADTGDAGNAIDFFVRIKGTSFHEAMRLLTS